MRRLIALVLAAFALIAPPVAFAAPIPYFNGPYDTVQNALNTVIASINTASPATAYTATCTGTTTSTCQGLRLQVSITGLSTAATAVSAAMVVTDASVSASSQIFCQPTLYAGTGVPNDVNIVPGAGSFSYQVQNNAAAAALNATVVSNCFVNN